MTYQLEKAVSLVFTFQETFPLFQNASCAVHTSDDALVESYIDLWPTGATGWNYLGRLSHHWPWTSNAEILIVKDSTCSLDLSYNKIVYRGCDYKGRRLIF